MRKILALFALLCLTSPAVADGLLGTGFPITLGTTVISGSSTNTTITGLSIAAGGSNTFAGSSMALGGATIGTDALGVTGTATISGAASIGNVNVTSATIPANGIYLSAANTLGFSAASTLEFRITGTSFASTNSSGPMMSNATASGTLPTIIPNRTSTTTGFGAQASGNISAIIAGVEFQRWTAGGVIYLGTIPSVTGTGTPTITTGSTDTSGEVTGGISATSIVITFAASKTNAPFCTVTSQTQLAAFTYTISTTAITITETATTGDKIDYVCFQH